jgi:hypothetical protein
MMDDREHTPREQGNPATSSDARGNRLRFHEAP